VLTVRATAAIGVIVCGQLLFGLLAFGALITARRRAGRRQFVQITVIICLVESLIIAIGLAAANAALGGNDAVTAGLLWYVGIGWVAVQAVVVIWIVWFWWRRRRAQ
jgi:predicted nucleic acid-binding protein